MVERGGLRTRIGIAGGGFTAQAPGRKRHRLAVAGRGRQDGFDATQKADGGNFSGFPAFGGDNHHGVTLLKIGERGRGHAIHDLLEVELPAGWA